MPGWMGVVNLESSVKYPDCTSLLEQLMIRSGFYKFASLVKTCLIIKAGPSCHYFAEDLSSVIGLNFY